MTRLQRLLLQAAALLVVGGGVAAFTYTQFQVDKRKIEEDQLAKRLFRDASRLETAQVKLTTTNYTMIAKRDDGGFWQIEKPIAGAGDNAVINNLIEHVVGIKCDSIAKKNATEADLKEFGLDRPKVTAELTLGNGTEHKLLVGAHNQMNGTYWITDGRRETICIAAQVFYESVDRDLFQYRDKRIIPYAVDIIDRISVAKTGEWSYDLVKKDDTWTITEDGATYPADPAMMRSFMLILTRDLKAEFYATDALDESNPAVLAELGLDKPAFKLEVQSTKGTISTILGHQGEGVRANGPFMRLRGTKTVVGVYPAFIGDLDKPGLRFRDRRVATFEYDKVTGIVLKLRNGQTAKLDRKSDGWFVSAPKKAKAKDWKIEGLLRGFTRLRAVKIVTDSAKPNELSEWLLAPPQQRLVVSVDEGKVAADIRFGKAMDEQHIFVTASPKGSATRVDLIEKTKLDRLPVALEDLIDDKTK